ncbi:MAG: TIGR02300 family protein [Caulobacteraceae bacterium]
MANPELGAKQICPSCQAKFYDLGRRPAVCPKCGSSFDPEEAVRSRRVRARTITPDYETEEEPKPKNEEVEGFEDEADDTPEIDEAVEADPVEVDEVEDGVVAPDAAEPDLGVDFEEEAALEEESDDVPFLEEEEDDFPDDEIDGLPDADAEDR